MEKNLRRLPNPLVERYSSVSRGVKSPRAKGCRCSAALRGNVSLLEDRANETSESPTRERIVERERSVERERGCGAGRMVHRGVDEETTENRARGGTEKIKERSLMSELRREIIT